MATDARYVGLNLGPRYTGPGTHVPLNLGVPWDVDPPDPPEPVVRGLRSALAMPWSRAQVERLSTAAHWSVGQAQRRDAHAPWGIGATARQTMDLHWTDVPRITQQLQLRWTSGMQHQRTGLQLTWRHPHQTDASLQLHWQGMALARQHTSMPWGASPPRASVALLSTWRGVLNQAHRMQGVHWGHPGLSQWSRTVLWGPAKRVPWHVSPPPSPPEPEPPSPFPPGHQVGLVLSCASPDVPGNIPLNLGVTACYAAQPRRRTYVVINDLSVVRIPDRTPIEVASVSISTAVDSWGSTFNIELADPSHLAYLKPAASGPRQIEVSLNGYTWTAIVESYGTQREFGRRVVTLTGRSRTALLAGPYAPTRAKVAGEPRSMAQLVAEELADTGFVSTYDTVDWVVPEGAWYYDSTTALDAINALAEASGGVVQSDPTAQSLRVRARYPHSPWDWRDVTPDHRLLEDIVITESLQVRSAPLYDAVIVTGELAGKGVTCRVRRAGSDGQLYAPQVSSPLISEAAAGAERGRNILADRGEQAAIDLVLPLFAQPVQPGQTGRVLPLDLVEVVGADGIWHGQCTAARWEARAGEDGRIVVEQTITLERHYTDAD